MQKIINFLILSIVILLPTSGLERYLSIPPAIFVILLLSLILILNTLLKGTIKKLAEPVKLFLIILFLILLVNIISFLFVPEMPSYVSTYEVKDLLKGPDLIRFYGILGYIVATFFIILAFLSFSKEFFLKIIKYHIYTSAVASSFGIANLIYYLLGGGFTFGIFTGWNFPRIRSFSVEPQAFANYLLTVIPFILYALVKKEKLIFSKSKLFIFLVINTIALVLTFSTGGYIAAIAVVFFFLYLILFNLGYLSKKWIVYLFLSSLVIFTAVSIMLGSYILFSLEKLSVFEISDISSSSAGVRLSFWKVAWEMIRDHPFFGVGPESYGYFYEKYAGHKSPEALVQPPQNLIIGMTANLGIFGGLLYLFLFLLPSLMMFKSVHKKNEFISFFAGSMMMVFFALFIQHMAFWWPYGFPLWFFIGLSLAFYNNIVFNKT